MANATKNKAESGNTITVRMFCQGLGDCFLLTIPQKNKPDYVILIDCGVAMGTGGEGTIMQQVMRKVAELTKRPQDNKGVVDLLVLTHEHRDHVSGFIQAENELSNIQFKNVWFAWTESRQDDLANQLRVKHAKEKAALARAVRMAEKLGSVALGALKGVQAFHEPIKPILGAKSGKAVDVADAMLKAGELSKPRKPKCLMPGKVLGLPDADADGFASNLQIFVLGPPHDGPALRRINPGKKNPETYEKAHASLEALGMSWTWAAAMAGHAALQNIDGDGGEASDFERAMPFEEKWRQKLDDLRTKKGKTFFNEFYFQDASYRRIDGDWLSSGAQQLALHMESFTNNTSLVLAFRLPDSQKVLLFPGDAQVGNWLSWHLIEEFKPEKGPALAIKCEELLKDTVLYKVGHHGSHNATLREKGLELMKHPELVAMLPVEAEAVTRLGYGEMPVQSLIDDLNKRAEGRLLRLDKPWKGNTPPGTWKTNQMKPRLSDELVTVVQGGKSVKRPLFMEYTVVDTL